ncbi:hypothetical protein [Streptomyces virginiae]|uniref:hypothetical protein n=1 Tax=Streptomyces virginiae TaxID=1961 RepID=UPI00324372E6
MGSRHWAQPERLGDVHTRIHRADIRPGLGHRQIQPPALGDELGATWAGTMQRRNLAVDGNERHILLGLAKETPPSSVREPAP